jgi:hypothetical protein
MALLKYVGIKPRKDDNVAGTKVVWNGPGDVQEVPDALTPKFLAHPLVWVQVEVSGGSDSAPPELNASLADASKSFVLDGPEGAVVLDDMDDAALREFARRIEVKVDGRLKGDKLRGAIVDAVKEAA